MNTSHQNQSCVSHPDPFSPAGALIPQLMLVLTAMDLQIHLPSYNCPQVTGAIWEGKLGPLMDGSPSQWLTETGHKWPAMLLQGDVNLHLLFVLQSPHPCSEFPLPYSTSPSPLQVIFNFLKKSCKKLHLATQTKTLSLLCLITCLLLPGYTGKKIIVLPNDICTSCSFTHHIPWHHSVCLSHSSSVTIYFEVFFVKVFCCCCF